MYSLNVNAIYLTYQGEVNVQGIGAPVIFIRLQGCHLRCYKDTLGTLCDTPEALDKEGGTAMSPDEIAAGVLDVAKRAGISNKLLVCLSGGDPLWGNMLPIRDLLITLKLCGATVSIETSGTISWAPYKDLDHVHFVLDYKLKSAGIKAPFRYQDIFLLKSTDFIKFVVYDREDYEQFKSVIGKLLGETHAKFAIGVYWGGKVGTAELFRWLVLDELLGSVVINFQAHKMVTYCDVNRDILQEVIIPKEI